jgi:hypothetical protein
MAFCGIPAEPLSAEVLLLNEMIRQRVALPNWCGPNSLRTMARLKSLETRSTVYRSVNALDQPTATWMWAVWAPGSLLRLFWWERSIVHQSVPDLRSRVVIEHVVFRQIDHPCRFQGERSDYH